ncbi:hypothetical protein BDY19DRAFT_219431 [Irpex rosettiformis]|uniref:Uncharacterized protein n=1 Tax=Irpex rosettiformis TaxID=378272 RepID=A0ACB8U0B0_9APHY|nr:hypothetical protein BDY19DRAFT_219431 [Irpex rosettiformis]
MYSFPSTTSTPSASLSCRKSSAITLSTSKQSHKKLCSLSALGFLALFSLARALQGTLVFFTPFFCIRLTRPTSFTYASSWISSLCPPLPPTQPSLSHHLTTIVGRLWVPRSTSRSNCLSMARFVLRSPSPGCYNIEAFICGLTSLVFLYST